MSFRRERPRIDGLHRRRQGNLASGLEEPSFRADLGARAAGNALLSSTRLRRFYRVYSPKPGVWRGVSTVGQSVEGRLSIQARFTSWLFLATFLAAWGVHQTAAPSAALADEPSGYFRETVMPGPPDVVWRLLTTEKGLESWLVSQAEVDLRVGGTVRTLATRDGKIGDPQTTAVSRILTLIPGRRFSVKVVQAPSGYPFAAAFEGTWYDVFVDPASGGKTKVRCVGNGLATGFAAYAVKPAFDQGMSLAFEQLRKAVVAQGTKGKQ